MRKILITGASGLVGQEVMANLAADQENLQVIAGLREAMQTDNALPSAAYQTIHFDFEDTATFGNALEQVDTLFLLRPPQLADVKKYFDPLIGAAIKKQVRHIIFLSVQGVESNTFIPHHKIEQLIINSGIAYTLLRPAYFMQNFLTSLHQDLTNRQRIYLPAGIARFTLVDVRDIGRAVASIIQNPQTHLNKAYDLTNDELLTFQEMADQLTEVLQKPIRYQSPNLLRFYLAKHKEGVPPMFILVMIMLHFLPRFTKPPAKSDCIQQITGNKPFTFRQFAQDYKQSLM